MSNNVMFITKLMFLTTAVILLQITDACDENQSRQGCRIQNGQCMCGIGCYSEYRYSSKEECRKALKGRRHDICSRNPCFNEGSCSQTSLDPGYRCRCEGTGFYGSRCQHACPVPGRSYVGNFPYECIVI